LSSLRRIVIALLPCLVFVQTGYAQAPPPTPVTMQQAVEQTLAHNPVLLASQQNLLSMKGQEVEAGLRANPNFGLMAPMSLCPPTTRQLPTATPPRSLASSSEARSGAGAWIARERRPPKPRLSIAIRSGRLLCWPNKVSPTWSWQKRP